MKIDRLSVRELVDLQAKVVEQIPVAKAREIDALRATVEQMAAEKGFRAADILSPSGKTRRKRKASPRWKDQKTGVEWAGSGRRPQNYSHDRAVQI